MVTKIQFGVSFFHFLTVCEKKSFTLWFKTTYFHEIFLIKKKY